MRSLFLALAIIISIALLVLFLSVRSRGVVSVPTSSQSEAYKDALRSEDEESQRQLLDFPKTVEPASISPVGSSQNLLVGRVLDAQSMVPLQARVYLGYREERNGLRQVVTSTDPQGDFSFDYRGQSCIYALAEGYVPNGLPLNPSNAPLDSILLLLESDNISRSVRIEVEADAKVLNLIDNLGLRSMAREGLIRGSSVTSSSILPPFVGSSTRRLKVMAQEEGSSFLIQDGLLHTAIRESSSAFQARILEPGRYGLFAILGSATEVYLGTYDLPGPGDPIHVTIPPLCGVYGRLARATDMDLGEGTIRVRSASAAISSVIAEVPVSKDLTFDILGLPDGAPLCLEYEWRSQKHALVPEFVLARSEILDLGVCIVPPLAATPNHVRGIVIDALTGAPLPDAVVSSGENAVRTDATGAFDLDDCIFSNSRTLGHALTVIATADGYFPRTAYARSQEPITIALLVNNPPALLASKHFTELNIRVLWDSPDAPDDRQLELFVPAASGIEVAGYPAWAPYLEVNEEGWHGIIPVPSVVDNPLRLSTEGLPEKLRAEVRSLSLGKFGTAEFSPVRGERTEVIIGMQRGGRLEVELDAEESIPVDCGVYVSGPDKWAIELERAEGALFIGEAIPPGSWDITVWSSDLNVAVFTQAPKALIESGQGVHIPISVCFLRYVRLRLAMPNGSELGPPLPVAHQEGAVGLASTDPRTGASFLLQKDIPLPQFDCNPSSMVLCGKTFTAGVDILSRVATDIDCPPYYFAIKVPHNGVEVLASYGGLHGSAVVNSESNIAVLQLDE